MTIEDLCTIIKSEFSKINKRIDALQEEMNGKISQINGRIDALQEEMNGRIDALQGEMNDRFDIITNVNMAKILEHQVETRKELNDKIDKFLLQNNLEHKQFAYQIAQLEMKEGITKIG